MQEWVHRCVLLVVLSLVVYSLVMGIVGANVYLDSGRSILRDVSTSTDYIWKSESCKDLFRGISGNVGGAGFTDQTAGLCDTARDNHLPPLALKSVIDAQIKNYTLENNGSSPSGPEQVRAVLRESMAEFIRQLPALKAHYLPYQKRVSYMWFFVFTAFGSLAAYYYARSCTPVLFAATARRFGRMLFTKNRYDDAWQSFIKPKKKP